MVCFQRLQMRRCWGHSREGLTLDNVGDHQRGTAVVAGQTSTGQILFDLEGKQIPGHKHKENSHHVYIKKKRGTCFGGGGGGGFQSWSYIKWISDQHNMYSWISDQIQCSLAVLFILCYFLFFSVYQVQFCFSWTQTICKISIRGQWEGTVKLWCQLHRSALTHRTLFTPQQDFCIFYSVYAVYFSTPTLCKLRFGLTKRKQTAQKLLVPC